MIHLGQRLIHLSLLASLLCVPMGCVTVELNEALSKGDAQARSEFYSKPAMSDVVVAIGRPDSELSRKLNIDHVIAFLGKKNTYILTQGGEELEHISRLKLDARRLRIKADGNPRLYLKDKQFWGQLIVSYGNQDAVPASEQNALESAGFSKIHYEDVTTFEKLISIQGLIYPAVRFSDADLARLAVPRAVSFFNPVDASPPANSGRALLGVAMAVDVALAPMYLGLGAVGLAAAPFNRHDSSPPAARAQETSHGGPNDREMNSVVHRTEYNLSHILLGTEEEANAIAYSLSQGGDFGEMARQKSLDVSGRNGGELGWALLDVYPKAFGDAVLNLKKGETSRPVETKYGWHIIKLNDLRDVEMAVKAFTHSPESGRS